MENSKGARNGVKGNSAIRRRCRGESQAPLGPLLQVVGGAKPDKPGDRMLAVQRMDDLTYGERSVLTVIAWHDGRGGAFPGQDEIARILGTRPSRVNSLLQSARRKGRIRWRRRHGIAGSNLYEVVYQIPLFPEFEEDGPNSGFSRSQIPVFPEGNRKNPERTFSGEDLCTAERCEGRFVEADDSCRRCGWQRPQVNTGK